MGRFKTPLRYPGGKQRLSPFIQELLEVNEIDGNYLEPYAGGAGIAMELLLSKKVKKVHLNDSDKGVYAFWYSVINHTEALCSKILSASMTIEEWKKRREILKNNIEVDLLELGFTTFFLNRCNRSGVLKGGVIGGIGQLGDYKMDARFNRNELISRIESIAMFGNQIFVTNMDAESYIGNYLPNIDQNSLIYLDPPYYNKASGLYLNSYKNSDHARIAKIIQNDITHSWILSYDGVPEILNLYEERRHFLYDLQYSAQTVKKGKEVFIFDDEIELPKSCSLNHVNEGLKLISG
ncbi:DNA adenine methylase [Allomuricauda sp. NBRC 101325]|uniref:DNA adenine methylase n=1 Tax=Allomuricauda sp. NBRC 101325 TaxID=1113758 RepID=UPI0024A40105|nr:DNA adenine methylase [Muricauda sp. NBRC 101325]GLU44734.1 DNA methyltransferase [Muricauda sp. NBRC 101325]